jgi:hypothetical protein
VRDGDVGDAPLSQLRDVVADFLLVVSEVEPALHGVDQRMFPAVQSRRQLAVRVRHPRPDLAFALLFDVFLHQPELVQQVGEVTAPGPRTVWPREVDLVERKIQGREDHADVAGRHLRQRHTWLVPPGLIVEQARQQAHYMCAKPLPLPLAKPLVCQLALAGLQVHRVVRVQVYEHALRAAAPDANSVPPCCASIRLRGRVCISDSV